MGVDRTQTAATSTGQWKDWAIAQYLYDIGRPPDNLSWDVAHDAFARVIARARTAEEAESNA